MTQITNAGHDNAAPERSPGYLMGNFRLGREAPRRYARADPTLYAALFSLSRRRMHLIALALSQVQSKPDASFAQLVIQGGPKAILQAVFGRCFSTRRLLK